MYCLFREPSNTNKLTLQTEQFIYNVRTCGRYSNWQDIQALRLQEDSIRQ